MVWEWENVHMNGTDDATEELKAIFSIVINRQRIICYTQSLILVVIIKLRTQIDKRNGGDTSGQRHLSIIVNHGPKWLVLRLIGDHRVGEIKRQEESDGSGGKVRCLGLSGRKEGSQKGERIKSSPGALGGKASKRSPIVAHLGWDIWGVR